MSTFNSINYPYGQCLKPSNVNNRNAYPTSATYGDGNDPTCIPSLVPSLYAPPTLYDIAKQNTAVVNSMDSYFLNNRLPPGGVSGIDFFSMKPEYSGTDLQAQRPKENYKNMYIAKASNSLHQNPDITMSLFFSDVNIEHLRQVIVKKVKEITADSGIAGSKEGVTIKLPDTSDLFYYLVNIYQNYKIHNGSICFIGLRGNTTPQEELSKLNSDLLQEYVSKIVSQINMYIYYYIDASTMPEQLAPPVLTSMKGSKVLEFNVGLGSGNSLGVASYNEVGNII
jgi:hypothetical protein